MTMKKHLFWKNKMAVAVPIESLIAFGIMVVTIGVLLANINNFFVPYIKTDSDLNYKVIDVCESLINNPGQTTYGSFNWEDDPGNVSVLGLAVPSTTYESNISEIQFVSNWANCEPNGNYIYPYENIIFYDYQNDPPTRREVDRSTMFEYVYMFPTLYYANMLDKTPEVYAVLNQSKIDALNNYDVSYEIAKQALGLDSYYNFNLTITTIRVGEVIRSEVALQYGVSYDDAEIVAHYSRNVIIYPGNPAKLQMYMFF